MQGLIQKGRDLRNASLDEIRETLHELLLELRFRFSTLSKENFGEKDLNELAEIILSDAQSERNRKATISVKDGVVTITAEEINLTGDVYVNGSPV